MSERIERLSKIALEKEMVCAAHAMINIAGLDKDEILKRRGEYDIAEAEKWKAQKDLLEAKLSLQS